MFSIIIGLIILFVVPYFITGHVKKKSDRKAYIMLCRIIGIAILVIATWNFIISMFN